MEPQTVAASSLPSSAAGSRSSMSKGREIPPETMAAHIKAATEVDEKAPIGPTAPEKDAIEVQTDQHGFALVPQPTHFKDDPLVRYSLFFVDIFHRT